MIYDPLLERCLAGDPVAWNDFALRYGPPVRGVIRDVLGRLSSTPSGDEADDILQDLFLSLMKDGARRLRTWRGESSLVSWLRSVAVRFTLDRLRVPRRLLHGSMEDRPYEEEEAHETLPPGSIENALSGISERDRRILELRYFGNLSYRAMAAVLQMRVNTLCPALHRARLRLRRSFGRTA